MAHLFIYGTLRDREVCEKVLGRAVSDADLRPAFAQGFATHKVADVSYPCLLPSLGAKAYGFILSNLSDDDIGTLDLFEGVNYRRVPIEVTSGDETIMSEYYRPNELLQTDGVWDLAIWQKEGKAAFLGEDFKAEGIRIPSHV